ncbi:MAG: hypothetical protein CM15mP128_0030 [Methanobacteriota archaeon]|nr:MAG: hypothetical protein CM15mP128_0030 [Euryarchaeota archaeon]
MFESLRPRLIEAVEDATAEGDTPEARSTYLRAAKSLGVDVAEPPCPVAFTPCTTFTST